MTCLFDEEARLAGRSGAGRGREGQQEEQREESRDEARKGRHARYLLEAPEGFTGSE